MYISAYIYIYIYTQNSFINFEIYEIILLTISSLNDAAPRSHLEILQVKIPEPGIETNKPFVWGTECLRVVFSSLVAWKLVGTTILFESNLRCVWVYR